VGFTTYNKSSRNVGRNKILWTAYPMNHKPQLMRMFSHNIKIQSKDDSDSDSVSGEEGQ
jgi:hypothetical protein